MYLKRKESFHVSFISFVVQKPVTYKSVLLKDTVEENSSTYNKHSETLLKGLYKGIVSQVFSSGVDVACTQAIIIA